MKKQGRRSWLLVSTVAALVAGCGDGEPAKKVESPLDSGVPADVADAAPGEAPDAASTMSDKDAGPKESDASAEMDATIVVPPSDRCPLDESAVKPGSLWSKDWTFHYDDPKDDDKGNGGYIYPAEDMVGGADLRAIDVAFDAATGRLSLSVGMTALRPQSRIGIILWDREHFVKELKSLEWALSGVEVRVPNWSRSGIATVLALPKRYNPLYDLTRNSASATGRRPDNTIFIRTTSPDGLSDDVKWMDCWGRESAATSDILELDVEREISSEIKTLSFDIPAAVLSSYLKTNDTAGGLAMVVYSFLVVSSSSTIDNEKLNEFGAFEISGNLGGSLDSEEGDRVWRDPDTYDVAFVDLTSEDTGTTLAKQNALLTPPVIGANEAVDNNKHIVVLTESSAGVGFIDTSGGGI